MPYRTLLDEFNDTGEIPADLELISSFRPIESSPEPEVRCPSCGRRTLSSETFDVEPPGHPPASRIPDSIRARLVKGRRPVPRWICDQCLAFADLVELDETGDLARATTPAELQATVRGAMNRNRDRVGGKRPEGPPGLTRPWTPGHRRANDHADGKGPPEVDPRTARR